MVLENYYLEGGLRCCCVSVNIQESLQNLRRVACETNHERLQKIQINIPLHSEMHIKS